MVAPASRAALVVATLLGAGALIGASFRTPAWIWNFTASAPLGLYRLETRPWRVGDRVAYRPSPALRALLVSYHALEKKRVLIKRIVAANGDVVCRLGASVTINDRRVASARAQTSGGRLLPAWNGCHAMGPRDVLLMGEGDLSFDGRYFGVSDTAGVMGPLVPILTFGG